MTEYRCAYCGSLRGFACPNPSCPTVGPPTPNVLGFSDANACTLGARHSPEPASGGFQHRAETAERGLTELREAAMEYRTHIVTVLPDPGNPLYEAQERLDVLLCLNKAMPPVEKERRSE